MDYKTWIEDMQSAALDDSEDISYNDDCYVLFIMTGHEKEALQSIDIILDNKSVKPFLPTIELPFRRRGIVKNEIKPMFPGYMFIRTKMPYEEFINKIFGCIRYSSYILKLLNYGGWQQVSMNHNERKMLESLWKEKDENNNQNENTCIKSSKAIIEGDTVIVTEGPLKDKESLLKKINRHKMQAVIEVELFGENKEITVGLEIVKKI